MCQGDDEEPGLMAKEAPTFLRQLKLREREELAMENGYRLNR